MRFPVIIIFILLSVYVESNAQKIYAQYADLERRLAKGTDTVYLINFWATWCKPCVEEIPYLNDLDEKKFGPKPLHILLVSLDFTSQVRKLVVPFIKNNKIRKEVIVLADPDMNTWIPKVNAGWDGAIPISILVSNKGPSVVYNQAFRNKEEIVQWINRYNEN